MIDRIILISWFNTTHENMKISTPQIKNETTVIRNYMLLPQFVIGNVTYLKPKTRNIMIPLRFTFVFVIIIFDLLVDR